MASQLAVETLANFFADTARDSEITWPYREDKSLCYDENRLSTGIRLSNRKIFELAQSEARFRGMGTTIVTLVCGNAKSLADSVADPVTPLSAQ